MKCLVFILIVTCSLSVYTQNNYTLSGTVIKSSDISLDEYGALLLDDSCAFHVVDNWGKIIIPNVCEWGFVRCFPVEVVNKSFLDRERTLFQFFG